jgi:hypothetical protein
MTPNFQSAQFVPTQFNTAEDKAKFANHFVRFVNSDFKQTLFYDWFYQRLSNTFGHIAQFNRYGFYSGFFTSTEGKIKFLQWCATYPCHGDPLFTFSDVERALLPFVREKIRDYVSILSREKEASERAEYERLKAKYENA